MFGRLYNRMPWQASAALGWTGLATVSTAAEAFGRESPALASSHQPVLPVSVGAAGLETLRTKGYLIIDDALDAHTLDLARRECAVAADKFELTDQHDAAVRSDAVHWIGESHRTEPGLLAVVRKLRGLAMALDSVPGGWPGFDERRRTVDLGVPMAAQLARYSAPGRHASAATEEKPGRNQAIVQATHDQAIVQATGGARYKAHRDGLGFGACWPMMAIFVPGIVMRVRTHPRLLPPHARTRSHPHPRCDDETPSNKAIIWPLTPDAMGSNRAQNLQRNPGKALASHTPATYTRHSTSTLRTQEATCIVYLTASTDYGEGGRAPPPRRVASGGECRDGALVLYVGADAADTVGLSATHVVEVLPVGGRLVLFDSRKVLHEVRPHTNADVDRLAVTVWIGGPHTVGGLLRHCRAWWTGHWPTQ